MSIAWVSQARYDVPAASVTLWVSRSPHGTPARSSFHSRSQYDSRHWAARGVSASRPDRFRDPGQSDRRLRRRGRSPMVRHHEDGRAFGTGVAMTFHRSS
ncbi:hypothetical protein GCM10010339_15980 [Streptomyces alanosinicus]|uniref:Uncharacterized protein n=1 Tax=Streptomyces alanosinicus TaxID=68171 RepID=A0A918YEL5_9ACTN|nr:hypothetical protein GCM10010339_15980 [Streptomyces alanosinicus]